MAKKKKKIYKNPYKEAKAGEGNTEAAKGKRKFSFKTYAIGASIALGFAAFFTQSIAVCSVSIVLFLAAAYLMGKQHFIFLAIGGLMALLISGLNSVNILYIIPLVWALFYAVLMLSGMFLMKKKSK